MAITYVVIVFIVSYIFGAITKTFIDTIPNRFIPLQNVLIGVISGILCYVFEIELDLLTSIVLCFMAAIGAGGTADLLKTFDKGE